MVDGEGEEEDGFVVFDIRDKGKKFRRISFFSFFKNNKIIDCSKSR